MPEIKRIFQAGIMNRDLDDRLLPSGQYRAALNVNIGRSEGSDIGAIENLLGNELIESGDYIMDGTVIGVHRDNGNERIYFFATNNSSADETNPADAQHAIYEYDQNSRLIRLLLSHNQLNFHTLFKISGVNFVDGLLLWTDNRNQPRKINIDIARNDPDHYIPSGTNELDDQIAVAKHSPYEAPTIINTSDVNVETGEEITSNFMEDRLIRFAYRWKFEDGEYSTISPFTSIIFNSNADDLTAAQITDALNNNEVRDFVNTIKSVSLSAPIPSGFGISEVELIYREAGNTTTYISEVRPVGGGENETFLYNSQDPFRALPGSQITRVYDAVPRAALSQEVAGARLVYGNYLQNYNIPELDFRVELGDVSHSRLPRHSVKSRRTYQVGVVLADRQGRQTPVILSSSGNDTIFVPNVDDTAENALQSLNIRFLNADEIPSWAYSYRIVVKQRQQEYYNWFSTTGSIIRSGVTIPTQTRFGDGVNKIPIDQTALVDQNALTRPSSRSVYRKIASSDLDNDNTQYRVTSINQTALVEDLEAAMVYETIPTESNLDIFFETSTGGLVSTLEGAIIDIDFYNCYLVNYSTTKSIEANRLRMGFNEAFFNVGIRAFVVQENFAEERRFNTLIHSSGIFNSRTGFNQLNQFNEAEGGITISLDPSDGSVQKLYAEDTQLIIFQEDKVSRSPIDKDFIYSAEGGAVPVTSNSQFLGTIVAYAGEYGISSDPLSFAIYGSRKYFTDKNRGVVLRLSQDGLSEISKAGMSDFFRDALRTSSEVIGSFDEYSDTYNLTIIGSGYAASEDTNVATAIDRYFTISFEEDVNGWSSFKSFKQEAGVTLNNRYYTFGNGNLWRHNSEAFGVARNSFYGAQPAESYVDLIFNDAPSNVKTFNTLGYEGTEGWTCEYFCTDLDQYGDVPAVVDASTVTLQISGSVGNGIVVGERVFIETPGTQLKWTIVVSPISSLYEFTSPAAVTLTTTRTDVDIISPTAVLENGNLVFEVDYTTTPVDDIIQVVIGGQSNVIFEVSLLIVNIDDQFSNATVSPGLQRFTQSDKDDPAIDNVVITITPDEGYRAESATIMPTLPNGNLGTPTSTFNNGVETITIPVTIPDDPTSQDIAILGAAIRFFILTYMLDDQSTDTQSRLPDPVQNVDDGDTPQPRTLVIDVSDQFIIDVDEFDAVSDGPSVITENALTNDEGSLTYTIQSPVLTADITENITLTGDATRAFVPAGLFEFDTHLAENMDVVWDNAATVDFTLAADPEITTTLNGVIGANFAITENTGMAVNDIRTFPLGSTADLARLNVDQTVLVIQQSAIRAYSAGVQTQDVIVNSFGNTVTIEVWFPEAVGNVADPITFNINPGVTVNGGAQVNTNPQVGYSGSEYSFSMPANTSGAPIAVGEFTIPIVVDGNNIDVVFTVTQEA